MPKRGEKAVAEDKKAPAAKKAPAKKEAAKKSSTKVVVEFVAVERVKKLFKKFNMGLEGVSLVEKKMKLYNKMKPICFVEFPEGKEEELIGKFLFNYYLHDMAMVGMTEVEVIPATDDEGAMLSIYEVTKDEIDA